MKIHELKEKIDRQITHLREEFSAVRTGRATTALVENIKVDAYEGSASLTIKELATITITDPTVILIKPWDLSLTPKIERAIASSPSGLNAVAFDDALRINLPPLSTERRAELVRVVKSKAESAKIEVRQIRQDEMRAIDEMEKNGVISKDERFKIREEVETIIREASIRIEKIVEAKEAELMTI